MLPKTTWIRVIAAAGLGMMGLGGSAVVSTAQAQPCCPCDLTQDNTITSDDYFTYLTLFFASDPGADIDQSGGVTSNDYFEFVNCFFSGCSSSLDEGFRSASARVADCSYEQLFAVGDAAFDTLLGLSLEGGAYAGTAYMNPLSSVATLEPVPAARVALYLFDAILQGQRAPYVAPRLVSTGPDDDQASLLGHAIPLYAAWWETHRGLPLETLRSIPGPLEGTDLAWLGLIEPTSALLPEGTEVATSTTPFLKIDGRVVAVQGAQPYIYGMLPAAVTGPTPYNCLAWAFGDNMNWWQPAAAAGGGLNNALANNGYAAAAVACAGQCPPGRGPKVMLVYVYKNGGAAADKNWIHAMRQQANGQWTSKNGQSSLWNNIVNTDAFLDQSGYKAGAGEMREVRCYCK